MTPLAGSHEPRAPLANDNSTEPTTGCTEAASAGIKFSERTPARPRSVFAAGLLLCLLCAVAHAGDYTYTTNEAGITITWYRGSGGAVSVPGKIDGLPVTCIGTYAFANRDSLTGVIMSEGLRGIKSGAFAGCRNLASLTLPSGLTKTGPSAFVAYSSLIDVAIPASVECVDKQNFKLYSIGWNEADDGGITAHTGDGKEDHEYGDWDWHYPTQ